MQNSVTTIIDQDSCIGCGLCVEVCPAKTISMQDGKAVVTGTYSMGCGHCEAVCPVDAIRVEILEHSFTLSAAAVDDRWVPYGEYDTGQLVRLMRSRRSCRNYTDQEIDRQLLEDLVKIGTTAPSGTNSQLWTFTVLANRKEVVILGELVAGYFHTLNRMAEKSWLRLFSKMFGADALGKYYRRYYETVRDGLQLWARAVDTPAPSSSTNVEPGGSRSSGSGGFAGGLCAPADEGRGCDNPDRCRNRKEDRDDPGIVAGQVEPGPRDRGLGVTIDDSDTVRPWPQNP